MKIARYNDNRLGLVEGDEVLDVTGALDVIPMQRYPLPHYDLMIEHLDKVLARAKALAPNAPRVKAASVKFLSPVANPNKIINAPINYKAHADEAKTDKELAAGAGQKSMFIGDWGLFLKANSALVGWGEEVKVRFPQRRTDHEIELIVVIGKTVRKATQANALDCVAGYAMGLDMTVRGTEDRSLRKSVDTYCACGPWLVTKDEIADPNNLDFSIKVNGELRQKSNTNLLVWKIEKLIEYATEWYTLYPGDILLTGTPEGVGPVKPGDVMSAEIEKVAKFDMRVAKDYA